MKSSFTFDLKSKNNNAVEKLRSSMRNVISNKVPFLFPQKKETSVLMVNDFVTLRRPTTTSFEYGSYTPYATVKQSRMDLYDAFLDAINRYETFLAVSYYKPDYDAVFMGRPVRFFDNFIQIGYDIIPRYTNRNQFYSLPVNVLVSIKETVVIINNNF